MSNALLRILTALLGVPLLLGLAYLGGWYFGLLVLVLALGAQFEVYSMLEAASVRPYKAAGLLLGGFVVVQPLLPWGLAVVWVGGLALLVWSAFAQDEQPLLNLAGTLFGIVYPAALFAFLTQLRVGRGLGLEDEQAFLLTLTVFLLIWATDILAYYSGKTLGRHKLAPSISPKKTWEGSIGGALGAGAVAVVLKLTLVSFLAWPHVVVLAVLCGVVSQVGDLAESRFKRSVGVKDSGALLPGHGGLLDRFDALILAVPLVVLYFAFVAPFFEG